MTEPSPLERIFFAALDLPESDRAAYLDSACAGDAGLRADVERMLAARPAVSGFLEADQTRTIDHASTSSYHPEPDHTAGVLVAGKYKLLEPIGEGGMGTVWRAQQLEPVKRFVAVKLIKAGMDSKSVLARFDAERQALAMMDHPNIAKVLDGGLHENRPFFVMELVKGVPITEYCDARKLTPRERLELFVPVCQAIQHAHQKGIIHRDIKPSNVLIAMYDDKPVPKVIDFGVAKATGATLTEMTIDTGFGGIVGTPQYMSPEQATLNNLDIDTRSDVYSLGVLLYELLAGSPPFAKAELEKRGLLEMLRVVREEEPPRPSTKLSTADALPSLSASRGTEPKKLTGLLRNELDWIVMKALEKDRARRCETANGFAADINRYLSGEPVLAHPPSAAYRLKKQLMKNRGAVVAVSLILLTLLAGIAGTTSGLIRADLQRRNAEEKQREAEADRARAARSAEAEAAQRRKAEQAEAETLADYRASTDDALQDLIGAKSELGPQEIAYLEKLLQRWKVFAGRQGSDERSRAIRSEGHFRLGLIWSKLGRSDESRSEFELSRSLRLALKEQYPDNVDYQKDLSLTLMNFGVLLAETGKTVDAMKSQLAARDLIQALRQREPAVISHLDSLASVHDRLGLLHHKLGDSTQAQIEYSTARKLIQETLLHTPGSAERDYRLAKVQHNLGVVLVLLKRQDEAREELKAARAILQKLAAAEPATTKFATQLGATHSSLGNVSDSLAQWDDARIEYQAACEIHDSLVRKFPVIPLHQHNLALARNNLGVACINLGRLAEAKAEFQRALDVRKKLVETDPAVLRYQTELGNSYLNMGNVLCFSEGQPQESLQWYNQAIHIAMKAHDRSPLDAYNRQCIANAGGVPSSPTIRQRNP